jgi:hypothetical protein
MKFVKKLLGKPKPVPTWDIKPTSERPAPRKRTAEEADEPEVLQVSPEVDPFDDIPGEEKNPWLDDEMLDTIQLEADDLKDSECYQTNTWEQVFDTDTRKLKTIPIGKQADKDSTGQFNPYDTGSMRRGWKK